MQAHTHAHTHTHTHTPYHHHHHHYHHHVADYAKLIIFRIFVGIGQHFH